MFAPVAGMSPLVRVVRALERAGDVVVAAAGTLADDVGEALVGQTGPNVRVVVPESPGDRAHCVAAALTTIAGGGDVIVHDIEWPLVGADTVDRIVASLTSGAIAVMPVRPVTDSVKSVGANGIVTGTLDRAQLRTVQYPRGFDADVLALLVDRNVSGSFDEVDAALDTGIAVTLIEGDDEALSVALPRDSDYLAALIAGRRDVAGC